ncbi:LCP family protein [Ancrocorticia populi]|uniref:Transcriptional regulator n=1 Tax=Ancrocorticia populi TaxID=2175228 RepID=A0A2V1K8G6_9ACTO|nr:LCP family protein [Ancrocorticia populi]PWF27413.1 transcriptional regulator [Ancrocorticia populi]
MSPQPPSFDPTNRRKRPSANDAKNVGHGGEVPRAEHTQVFKPEDIPSSEQQRPVAAGQASAQVPPSYAPAGSRQSGEQYQQAPQRPSEPPRGNQPPGPPPAGRRPRKKRRKWPIVLIVVLALIIGWPGFLIIHGNNKMEHVDALSDAADTPGTTYLIVGSDQREEDGINDGATDGQRADSIMLLQVPESGNAALVSLPRDSYVEIPGYGASKINASYSLGGPELLVSTVENLSGMTVDHYVEVSMSGVSSLVDAVGGVNLCLDYDVSDKKSKLEWEAGCHDADGDTALAFSRMRYSDPKGDIGRAERQRQVVSKVIKKAASPSTLINPVKQYKLVDSAATTLTMSTGSGLTNMAGAALGLRSVMGDDGLMGAPPISSLNYRTPSGASAVLLDPDTIDSFFEKMKNGELTQDDFTDLG